MLIDFDTFSMIKENVEFFLRQLTILFEDDENIKALEKNINDIIENKARLGDTEGENFKNNLESIAVKLKGSNKKDAGSLCEKAIEILCIIDPNRKEIKNIQTNLKTYHDRLVKDSKEFFGFLTTAGITRNESKELQDLLSAENDKSILALILKKIDILQEQANKCKISIELNEIKNFKDLISVYYEFVSEINSLGKDFLYINMWRLVLNKLENYLPNYTKEYSEKTFKIINLFLQEIKSLEDHKEICKLLEKLGPEDFLRESQKNSQKLLEESKEEQICRNNPTINCLPSHAK